MTGNSTLTATNNAYSGVWVRILNVDGTCTLDVENNGYGGSCTTSDSGYGTSTGAATNAGISFWGNATPSTIAEGANVLITNNAGSGIACLQGISNLTIHSATIVNNGTNDSGRGAAYGGGIYTIGSMCLEPDVVIYNNHADTAGDDIYFAPNSAARKLTFSTVGNDWRLDGKPDCEDLITGWYDDSEGIRWEAHTVGAIHAEEFTEFADGIATVTGLTALKAAHGLGSLTVSKIIAPDNGTTQEFDITVTINDAAGNTDEVPLSLAKGTSEIVYIPYGADYVVTETDYTNTNYNAPVYVGETGTITETNQDRIASVINIPVEEKFGALVISKTVEGDGAFAGDEFTFTLGLPVGSYEYFITSTPNDVKAISATGTVSNGGTITLRSGQSAVICNLPVGSAYSVTEMQEDSYTTTVETVSGTIDGTVVTGTIPASGQAAVAHYTNTYEASEPPAESGLSVEKELTEVNGWDYTGGRVDVGDELTYTITIINTGETVLEDITVMDALPAGLRLVGGEDDQWTIDTLAPGASVELTITVRVLSSAEGDYLTNTATASVGDLEETAVDGVWVDEDDYTPRPPRPDDGEDDGEPAPEPQKPDESEEHAEDVPGLNTEDHYAYIIGYKDGTVRPEGNITRAEVATIFFRLMTDEYRETYWTTNSCLSDVAAGSWYNNAISTTANVGWVQGYPDGTFQPNNYITRAEFATIVARFLSGTYTGGNLFSDIDGHWAADYINRAAAAGWINGYPNGTFQPNAYISRAEACAIVNRVLGRAPDAGHLLVNMIRWPDNLESAWYYADIQEATNSHDYMFSGIGAFEVWTELLANRDWAALEEIWSQANDAPGGEVMG